MLIFHKSPQLGQQTHSSSNPPACSSGCLRSSSLFSRLSLINTFCTEKLINESHAHAIWGQMYLSTETEERATMVSSPTVDGWRVQSHVVGTTGGTVEASKKSVKFICNYGLEDGWKGHDGKLAGGWVGATWANARGIGGNHRWCRCGSHGFKKIRRIHF